MLIDLLLLLGNADHDRHLPVDNPVSLHDGATAHPRLSWVLHRIALLRSRLLRWLGLGSSSHGLGGIALKFLINLPHDLACEDKTRR